MLRLARLVFPGCLILLTVFAAQAARLEDPVPPGVDPAADAALRKMGRSLATAREFAFRSNTMFDQLLDNGQKVQLGKTVNIRIRRPDAISAQVRGDVEDMDYAYNGTKLTVFNRGQNFYAVQDVPNNIDAMFDFMAEKFGMTTPLSDLMFADPYQTLIARVRTGVNLGLHEVGGVKCHHLAFRQEGIDWQIWIEDSPKALPRKVVITYKEQPGHPQFIALLDKWDLSPPPSDSTFELTPPKDAKHIDLVPLSSAPATQPAGKQ